MTTDENLRNEIRTALCEEVMFKPRHYRIISEGVAYALGKIEYPAGAEAIVREEAEAELTEMAKMRTILDDMREVLPKDRDTRADLLAVAQQIGRAVYPFCYEVGEGKAAVDAMAHYQEADLYEHRLKMAEAPSVVLNSDVPLASNRAQSALRHLLRYMEGGEVWHLPKAWLSARETLEAAHDGEALRVRMRALDLAVVGALPEWLRHDMGMDTPPVMNVVQADAQQPAPQRGLGPHWERVAFLYRVAQDALSDAKSDKRVVELEKEVARLREAIEGAIEAKNYMERLAILRRALATGAGTGCLRDAAERDVAPPERESDEAYRIRLLDACPDGAAYTAEDIGNLSGEALDGIGARLGVTRA